MSDEHDHDGGAGGDDDARLEETQVDESQLKLPQFTWQEGGEVKSGEEDEETLFKQCVRDGGLSVWGDTFRGARTAARSALPPTRLSAAAPPPLHAGAASCTACRGASGRSAARVTSS